MPYFHNNQYLPLNSILENSRKMGDFEEKVKVTAKKAKVTAKKAKKAIVKHGKKAAGACKIGWAKLKKSIKEYKDKNKRIEYLGDRH